MKIVLILSISLVALAGVIASCIAGAPDNNAYALPDDWVPSSAAIKQSNLFSITGVINEPILDGWQHQGFKTVIDRNGKFSSKLAPSTVVDREIDPQLKNVIRDCKDKFASYPSRTKAEAISRYVGQRFACGDSDLKHLYNWYYSFCNRHKGERILIGGFLAEGKGVCEQDAILQKVLFDELGVDSKLLFGYDRSESGHLWGTAKIDGKELVFDPSMRIFGMPVDGVRGHKPVSEIYGDELPKLWMLVEVDDLQRKGSYALAAERLGFIADIEKKRLGETHPHYAVILERRANLYEQAGKSGDAESLFKKVAQIYGKAYGLGHHEYADSLQRLGRFYASNGSDDLAEKKFKEAVSIYKKSLGPADATVGDTLFNLARLKEGQGDMDQAARLYEESFLIYRNSKGECHQDTEDAHEGLVRSRQAVGQP